MDIEAVVARRLAASTGVPAFVEMPPGDVDPGDLLLVTRTGGGGTYMEAAQIDVDCYSTKEGGRKRARELSELVKRAVPELDEEPDLFAPEVTGCYRQADPDTRRPRYVVQLQVWVCE